MTHLRQFNRALLLACGIFLGANVAAADQYESSRSDDIDLEKIEQHKAMHREKRAQKRERRGQHLMMRKHERLDTNEDGKVDLNEFLSHAESRFNEMDADSDQFVTQEEAKLHHKSMRKKHKDMRKRHKQMRAEENLKDADK